MHEWHCLYIACTPHTTVPLHTLAHTQTELVPLQRSVLISLTAFTKHVYVHECTHLCAHTETRLVPLAVSLDSYFSNCTWCRFTYLPMHHIHHTHTHTHTCTQAHTCAQTCSLSLYQVGFLFVFTQCTCA